MKGSSVVILGAGGAPILPPNYLSSAQNRRFLPLVEGEASDLTTLNGRLSGSSSLRDLKKGSRNEAIKMAEQVPLGLYRTESSAKMLHADKRRGEPRGKLKI